MKTVTSNLVTQIVNSEDGTRNFEVTRTWEDMEGKSAVILTIYPSYAAINPHTIDSTTMYMLGHLAEDLKIRRTTVINLFSKIVRGSKMSLRNLVLDETNLEYISKLMQREDFKDSLFIVAYGSSMKKNKIANEMKEKVISLHEQLYPDKPMYQFACDGLKLDADEPVHPLFLGVRGAMSTRWRLEPFTMGSLRCVESEEHLPPKRQGKTLVAKNQRSKNEEKGEAEDVL